MAVYRVVKSKNYTVVDNGYLDNPNLSRKAKGLLTYFLRLPSDWKINLEEIATHATDGIASLKTGLNELKEQGYVIRQPVRDENGVFIEWETLIFEKKGQKESTNVENNPLADYPQVENPQVENPQVENHTLLNTNNTNYLNKPNTELIYSDDFKNTLIEKWNCIDDNVPKINSINAGTNRYKLLKARINEYSEEDVLKAIDNISKSRFLKGYSTNFKITFDWFLRPNNFPKVLEGNYTDRKKENSRELTEIERQVQAMINENIQRREKWQN